MLRLLAKIPHDKLLHAYCCTIIALFLMAFFLPFMNKWLALSLSNFLTMLVFFGKEVYDGEHPDEHSVEINDIIADFCGMFITDLAFVFIFLTVL